MINLLIYFSEFFILVKRMWILMSLSEYFCYKLDKKNVFEKDSFLRILLFER